MNSPEANASAPLRTAAFFLSLTCLLGYGLALLTGWQGLGLIGFPSSNNVFYYLYNHYESWFMLATVGVFALLWVRFRRPPLTSGGNRSMSPVPVPVLALVVIVICGVGAWFAYRNHPLSMDEYFTEFQTRLFLHGQLFGEVPASMRPVEAAATPLMARHNAARHLWVVAYLPCNSLLRVPFSSIGLGWLWNPVLAGLSVLLAAGCARRIWPESSSAPWVAAVLLATSAQFLVTSMTLYAMPAHLCLNLLWLWLYLRKTWLGLVLASLVGVAAMGLHQINIHVLFVAAFFVGETVSRRWGRLAWLAGSYALILGGWLQYMRFRAQSELANPLASSAHTRPWEQISDILSWPSLGDLQLHTMNFALVWSWQSIALALFALVAILRIRQMPRPLPELLLGALLNFGFYFLFPSDQGHGWGYRYFYVGLVFLVLLGTGGWEWLRSAGQERVARRTLLASSLAALFLQIPLRSWEMADFSAPFARAERELHAIDADYVIVDTAAVWYGQDLVRNLPFAQTRPVLLFASRLGPDQIGFLRSRGGEVVLVPAGRLFELGLTPRFSWE